MAGEGSRLAEVRTVLLAMLALVAVAYVAVVVLYNPGGDLSVTSGDPQAGDVTLRVEVVTVDPDEYTALLRTRVTDVAPGLLNADERIAAPLRLAFTSGDGTDDVILPAGTALGRDEVTVGVSGDESGYPFDTYQALVTVEASVLDPSGDPTAALPTPVPLAVEVVGGVPGWNTEAIVSTTPAGAVVVDLGFVRAFSTKFFAILLVLMALMIALYSVTVGIATLTGRQPIDSSIVGWGASLLFALLALRYYLPGGPPIGAGVDVYAYVWVMVLAFLGLSMSVTMWLRR